MSAECYGEQGADYRSSPRGFLKITRQCCQHSDTCCKHKREYASTAQSGNTWDIADFLQEGDTRLEILKAVYQSFEAAKPKLEEFREDPSPDVHWALWVDCICGNLPASSAAYSTRRRGNSEQTRHSKLRRKLVSEEAVRREQMENFWAVCGHVRDHSEQNICARHRLKMLG